MWDLIEAADCWEWQGYVTRKGYGQYGRTGHRRAHVRVWEALVGPIPQGMTLDHRCRNRLCVNPDHMEVVPMGVNVLRGFGPPAQNARKATCKWGHNNWRVRATGGRRCVTCSAEGR